MKNCDDAEERGTDARRPPVSVPCSPPLPLALISRFGGLPHHRHLLVGAANHGAGGEEDHRCGWSKEILASLYMEIMNLGKLAYKNWGEMEVQHMNGGNGEASYAANSLCQRKVISLTRTIREHAINEAYCRTFPNTLCIADLGCSSGPNTLLVIYEAIDTIYKTCQKLRRKIPEFQLHLNDLPSNDFNNIFNSFPSFQAQMRDHIGSGFGSCFLNGVPGSFYGRLFPLRSLHFVHSSYSLQWLSQVPKGIESNGRNINISKGSPPSVLKAYKEQFQRDFSRFLKCRSEEVVEGGRMVLTFRGRISDDFTSKECTLVWDILAMALNEMATEGVIEEEKIEAFNIPEYNPCPAEINSVVNEEGSFVVDNLYVSSVNWCASKEDYSPFDNCEEDGFSFAKCIRAVVEPLLATKFETTLLQEIFHRFERKIVEQMRKEAPELTNVTVSLRRVN